jgi:hypothetical protein
MPKTQFFTLTYRYLILFLTIINYNNSFLAIAVTTLIFVVSILVIAVTTLTLAINDKH